MRIVRAVRLAALVVALGACRDLSAPPPKHRLVPPAPKLSISDGAHGGSSRLYFLPPIAPAPTFSGTFDPTAFGAGSGDAVDVCKVETIFVCSTIVSFGPGDVTMDPVAETYQAIWHTASANLDPLFNYRIIVSVGGQRLGFADIMVVTSGSDKRAVDRNLYVPVKPGTTLPIVFRLEKGATVVVSSGGTITANGDDASCTIAGTSTSCWGLDIWGNLGDGQFYSLGEESPVLVTGQQTFTSITAGGLHTCGLTSSGVAYCWGRNEFGELGIDLAPGPDARIATTTSVNAAVSFSAISAGLSHSCGLTAVGAAYCWGSNAHGQLGDGTNTDRATPTPVAGSHVFKLISAGDYHTCAIDFNNETYCWGDNTYGQAGGAVNTNLPSGVAALAFVSISAGGLHTCGVLGNGQAYCWGFNGDGELGTGFVTLSSLLGAPVVDHDAQGNSVLFRSISAGFSHSCGITTSGAAYCWGADASGELGDANFATPFDPQPNPQLVVGGLTWSEVSAGRLTTCGRSTAGAVYCWGQHGVWESISKQFDVARQPALLTLP